MVVRKVKNYTIIKELGRGSFGVTYLAENQKRVKFAIKEISKIDESVDIEVDALEQISYELEGCAEHVLCMHEYFEAISPFTGKNAFYIVTEFIDGSDLYDFLQVETSYYVDPDFFDYALYLMADISKGVKEIHDKGFAHRDLKPENIMYNKDQDKAIIIDLGLACDSNESCSGSAGSMPYAPPEILDRSTIQYMPGLQRAIRSNRWTKINRAMGHDIWSLGVIFYLIVNGQLPYVSTENPKETAKNARSIVLSTYPIQELNDLIYEMLSYDPVDRPSIDDILIRLNDLMVFESDEEEAELLLI